MPKCLAVLAILLSFAVPSFAQSVKLPKTAAGIPGQWVIVPFEVDGGAPRFRASFGLAQVNVAAIFPDTDTKKARAIVVTASAPGTYVLEAWNAKGDAASEISVCTVTVGAAAHQPAAVKAADAGKYFFFVVRPNDSNKAEYTAYLANAGWGQLAAAGHKVQEYTVNEAAAYGIRFGTAANQLGVDVPYGTQLPFVLTLQTTAAGKSRIVRGPVLLPPPAEIVNIVPQ
jgi:hypothetical protein